MKCTGLHTYNELIHSRSERANVARRVAELIGEAMYSQAQTYDMGVACDGLLTALWLISAEKSDSEYMGGDLMPPGHVQGQ